MVDKIQMQKFQMELLVLPNLNKNGPRKQLCVMYVLSINAENNITWTLLPLQILPWLREHMVEMLMKHDGTELIEQKTAAKIPKQFLMDGLELIEGKQ